MESFSKGNFNFNFYKDFYEKAQTELSLRKHMLPTNNLIDSMLYIASVGAPNLQFLLEGGRELTGRTLSVRNFQHPNRLLKLMIVLKTYFKDPNFIEVKDLEWRENAIPLYDTYRDIYIEVISPILRLQFENMRKTWFNPRIFAENLGFVCFLNNVFQERNNLKDVISQIEGFFRYHCMWYVFFLRAQKWEEGDILIEGKEEIKLLNGKNLF